MASASPSEFGAAVSRTTSELVNSAIQRSRILSLEGIAERAFALAFSGLVYPQIWEDPAVDLRALQITANSRIITIASGGCNVMSYLTASPAHITAVDLNTAHVALNRLKLAAALHVPDHGSFARFFGDADTAANLDVYERWIRPHLDPETRAYWEGRDGLFRRRIERFAKGFYRFGLLGRFIAMCHLLARLHGADPARILSATTVEEQRVVFESELAPLFDAWLVKWLIARPASLFGLGIPPVQYKALAADHEGGIGNVLRSRLERLACGFPLDENYFAWQAFARRYQPGGARPIYLQAANFEAVRANAHRVSVRHASMTEHLVGSPEASFDCYILLDAQDWMDCTELNRLWIEITRTARRGARVIFRTAAECSVLPGKVDPQLLSKWRYEHEASRRLSAEDRSAIYGGFHLYVFED